MPVAQLVTLIKARLTRIQYRPGLIDGFLAGTGLDLTPFPFTWPDLQRRAG